eukprot:Pgem_evm1s16472
MKQSKRNESVVVPPNRERLTWLQAAEIILHQCDDPNEGMHFKDLYRAIQEQELISS